MDDLGIRDMIHNIMDKALIKNANTKADIFISLRAHIQTLCIEIYNEGWSAGMLADNLREIKILPSDENSTDTIINNLAEVIDVLNDI